MSIRLDIIEAMWVLNPIVAKFQQAHFRSQCNRMLELYELKKSGTGSWLSDPTSSAGPTNHSKELQLLKQQQMEYLQLTGSPTFCQPL
ncbi:unnamed protein product [Sphagnum jensenii]|uniref:Uncharacterized protein n=1 Tax=Sphagnum jensenii TaxID=128206 RepID=A0ABP1BP41_9BRYO